MYMCGYDRLRATSNYILCLLPISWGPASSQFGIEFLCVLFPFVVDPSIDRGFLRPRCRRSSRRRCASRISTISSRRRRTASSRSRPSSPSTTKLRYPLLPSWGSGDSSNWLQTNYYSCSLSLISPFFLDAIYLSMWKVGCGFSLVIDILCFRESGNSS